MLIIHDSFSKDIFINNYSLIKYIKSKHTKTWEINNIETRNIHYALYLLFDKILTEKYKFHPANGKKMNNLLIVKNLILSTKSFF